MSYADASWLRSTRIGHGEIRWRIMITEAHMLDRNFTRETLLAFPWREFRKEVSRLLLRLRDKNGYYRLSESSKPTLIATSICGLLARSLGIDIGDKWTVKLLQAQSSRSGHFIDSAFVEQPSSYLQFQTTYFARAALRSVGITGFRSLDPCVTPWNENPICWVESLDWVRPWDCGNWLMFALESTLLTPCEMEASVAGHCILEWLTVNEDANTGFWGYPSATPLEKMCGGMHMIPFILCYGNGISPSRATKMKDTVMGLQSMGGFFYPIWGGGACPDYDGVATLHWLGVARNSEKISLLRAYFAQLTNFARGLFIEANRIPGQAPLASTPTHIRSFMEQDLHHYSGSGLMRYKIDEPTAWACWVRGMAIGMIQNEFGYHAAIRFLKAPGLGWALPVQRRHHLVHHGMVRP